MVYEPCATSRRPFQPDSHSNGETQTDKATNVKKIKKKLDNIVTNCGCKRNAALPKISQPLFIFRATQFCLHSRGTLVWRKSLTAMKMRDRIVHSLSFSSKDFLCYNQCSKRARTKKRFSQCKH